jgi:hypothetical protein
LTASASESPTRRLRRELTASAQTDPGAVDDGRHFGRHLFARPAIGLLIELELEIVDPQCAERRPAEINSSRRFDGRSPVSKSIWS